MVLSFIVAIDFINDYAVKPEYESDKAIMVKVIVNDNNLSYNTINVERRFINNKGSIPHLI